MTMNVHEDRAAAMIAHLTDGGKNLDYEQLALDGVRRSWETPNQECMKLALLDALVFAVLHLARVTGNERQAEG
jgi:hypothetical protein